ncbi:STAS domain-containing protein [Helicovermis profundi]|uniref:STAS domain-containing protein n=1 Tax=Helicovermis profundi TaxID=3065157 RepID=A0AAU9E8T2_9FIRM|nr:hypothetical protein HLPR_21940 [Clostridia bacterium S502]
MIKTIENDAIYIKMQKDLVAPNISEFKSKIVDFLEDNEDESEDLDEVILNLSEIDNIDSMGVTFVVGLYKSVVKEGKSFRIEGCSDDIKQLFKLMKLDEFFDIDE